MDQPPDTPTPVDRTVSGPLDRAAAGRLLDQGAALLEGGDYGEALATYQRVVGFDDPEVTAAALLGMAQARYRMDDEDAAVRTWEAILELPETTSTYQAWRNIAAARVREGDLNGAIAAYREADRRAPSEDKPEIANRLGWLAKETGNVRASRRYFARGRGTVLPYVTYAILGVTIAFSLTAFLSSDGSALYTTFELFKPAVAGGEIWRLLTLALLHGQSADDARRQGIGSQEALMFTVIHLGSNMYALYIVGPLVERIYGAVRFLGFYAVAAIGGSLATFAFGDAAFGTGASGAIFGLFGAIFIATRVHRPVLDMRGRAIASQIGFLILFNIVIGLSFGFVDNIAHIGGLVTGGMLAFAFVPGRVATIRSMWQPGANGALANGFIGSPFGRVGAILVLVVLMVVAWIIGLGRWG